MIGVAFALHGTFGSSTTIENSAFDRVLREFARVRNIVAYTHVSCGASLGEGATVLAFRQLREAFSTALGPYLLQEVDYLELEAMFASEAARLLTERFVIYDDVARTLRELAALNIPRVGLSGGCPAVETRKAQIAGFTSPIIFAQDLGVEDSAPVAFARICQTLLLPADRIWFVGTDVRAEILPAAAAGMRTIWLNRDGETFPLQRVPPDATVSSFAGILEILSAPYTRGSLALRYIMRNVLEWRPQYVISAEDMSGAPEPDDGFLE
jgi:FMN phosphatase YigB (HAD superfamily)